MTDTVEGSGIVSARDALRNGRPDIAAAILDQLVASKEELGKAVPLLAEILRDNARDMRLLDLGRGALSLDVTECGSLDHLDHRFRRRIASASVFDEIAALACLRPEASPYLLMLADDFLTAGRVDAAEAVLRKIAPLDTENDGDYLQLGAALAERHLESQIGLWQYLRGRIALARGDLRRALDAFASAARVDPRLFAARTLAGQICRQLGMGARASAFFDLESDMSTEVYTGW
jgi:tetratricopeptide (TPR) repeat protein